MQSVPGDGYIAKFGPDGAPIYISYLGDKPVDAATAVAVDPLGAALVGSASGRLVRIDPTGSRLTYSAYLGGSPEDYGNGPSAIQVDAGGNVYVAGNTSLSDFPVTPGAFSSELRSSPCRTSLGPAPGYPPGDVFVMKLRARDFEPVYSALLGGECWSQPQRMLLDADGIVTITGQSVANAYPLRSPELGPVCGGVLSRLGSQGELLYSSRLCGGPAAAFAPDGGLYVTSSGSTLGASSVLRLTVPEPVAVSLDQVANAFSGSPAAIAPATLVRLSGTGLGPDPAISLEWTSSEALPFELGGTQVLFDGQPARILYAGENRILCVTPAGLKDRAVVQVVYAGKQSNVMGIGIATTAPALLTHSYPDVPPFNFGLDYPTVKPEAIPDGFVLNEDGTWNDALHPAAPGSTVTLFATGLGVTTPFIDPGSPAPSDAAQPARIYGYWSSRGQVAVVESASTAPGLIAAISQVRVKIPEGPPQGATERLVLSLGLVPFSAWSNPAAIYVAAGN